MTFNKITILVDNESWIIPYAEQLVKILQNNFSVHFCRSAEQITEGDICFLLGCTQLLPKKIINKNKYNLVVHESNLPEGKGFAPMAWQIIEGKNIIPILLIEASEEADSGKIWLKDEIILQGTELSHQWRKLQGEATIKIALKFINEFNQLTPQQQIGKATYYAKRTPKDSMLDIEQPLKDLIPLLRTVDNKNYPALFKYKGTTYRLEIHQNE